MKSSALDRFLHYIQFDTTSDENAPDTHPSTPGQSELARALVAELAALGAERVRLGKWDSVLAEIPASPGLENAPVLGLIAHLDTSDAASGRNIKPQVFTYPGGVIELPAKRTLDPAQFPRLWKLAGKTLVTSDGSTLLGADNKAGIAAIVSAAEQLLKPDAPPHGALRIAFLPDEEIGQGADALELETFGAQYAYTIDGDDAGEIQFQNFNAARAVVLVHGFAAHPGSAKGVMKNAALIAAEFARSLPTGEVPENTENLEGFYYLSAIQGSTDAAKLVYLVRDHDAENFERRHRTLELRCQDFNGRYGAGTVELQWAGQYRNMEEVIRREPFLIEIAEAAMRESGLPPRIVPIRGGTGGGNFHSECEFVVVEELEANVRMLLKLAELFARRTMATAAAKGC